MKIKLQSLTLIILSIMTITSCASKRIVQKERSENFIADIEPFYIDELHLYTTMNISQPKVSDFELTFSPRINYINIKSKLGVDIIKVGFSYSERQTIKELAEKYINDYENKNITNEKPSKKNALYKSTIPLSWGVFGLTHNIVVPYYVNIEYLESNKPYFRMKFEGTTDINDDSTSPSFCIYISPSQWKSIFEMCDQTTLEAKCDEILAQAEAF